MNRQKAEDFEGELSSAYVEIFRNLLDIREAKGPSKASTTSDCRMSNKQMIRLEKQVHARTMTNERNDGGCLLPENLAGPLSQSSLASTSYSPDSPDETKALLDTFCQDNAAGKPGGKNSNSGLKKNSQEHNVKSSPTHEATHHEQHAPRKSAQKCSRETPRNGDCAADGTARKIRSMLRRFDRWELTPFGTIIRYKDVRTKRDTLRVFEADVWPDGVRESQRYNHFFAYCQPIIFR